MGIIFGSARIDENGNISGGSAGDQSGKEVSTQAYYMHAKGWYCLRPKSVDVANKIATAMQQACDNNKIGYDQNQRNTVMTQLKAYGSLAAIKTKCEADCSSLVRACIYQATGKDAGDIYTGNLASALEDSGLFEKRFSVSSESQLYNGDVLVTKTKGHTVVVVSGRSRGAASGNTNVTGDSYIVQKGDTLSAIAKSMGVSVDELASYNGISNPDVINVGQIIKNPNSANSTSGSSLNESAQWTGKVTASSLNVRTWAGTSYDTIKSYPKLSKGETVGVCDTVNASDGTPWYYVLINSSIHGFVSSQYIEKIDSTSNSSEGSLNESSQWTGKCTASSLHVRSWAGTEYDDIKSYPRIYKGDRVGVCDTVKASDGSDWYYILINNKVHGFVSARYIAKA